VTTEPQKRNFLCTKVTKVFGLGSRAWPIGSVIADNSCLENLETGVGQIGKLVRNVPFHQGDEHQKTSTTVAIPKKPS